MKTILITGADGQLGNEFKKISDKDKRFKFLFTDVNELDISDIDALKNYFDLHHTDYIVNCAAYTNVDLAESEEKKAVLINAEAVRNLAQMSSDYKVPLFHISTDYVFDGESKLPYKEDDSVNPTSAYGRSKLLGEEYAKNAYKFIIIRTSWLYSAFGHNFVKTILRICKEKEKLKVVSDQTGSPTYAADLAFTIFRIIEQTQSNLSLLKSGIYHYSNEGECTWFDFASEIITTSGIKCNVIPVSSEEFPTTVKRPKYSLMSKEKIKKTFIIAVPDWKHSLKRCLKELKLS